MTRDQHIENCRKRLAETMASMARLESLTYDYDCCPGCKWGTAWSDLEDRSVRQSTWLIRLLMKRDAPGDAAEALTLMNEHGIGIAA